MRFVDFVLFKAKNKLSRLVVQIMMVIMLMVMMRVDMVMSTLMVNNSVETENEILNYK